MRTCLIAASLMLGGCANELYPSLESYMAVKRLPPVSAESFPHCEGYGCPRYKNVILNRQDWRKIEKAYGRKARDAEEERHRIARAVGAFERVVGPLAGTGGDRAGTFIQTGAGQLDCVDESTNTTIYMMLLKEKGFIRFHDILQPQVRYPIISGRGWMHQTAVVREKKTGRDYAIDSWFEDNGEPAWVVPMDLWRDGWRPPERIRAADGAK